MVDITVLPVYPSEAVELTCLEEPSLILPVLIVNDPQSVRHLLLNYSIELTPIRQLRRDNLCSRSELPPEVGLLLRGVALLEELPHYLVVVLEELLRDWRHSSPTFKSRHNLTLLILA